MPRRNLIPLAMLALLTVLAVVFAVLAISSAPNSDSLAVQNASGETFGSPTGANSFSMELTESLPSGPGTPTLNQVHLIKYVAPDRMAVFQLHPRRQIAVLNQAAITCTLTGYTSLVGGTAAWAAKDSSYVRTESLADYASRVPQPVDGSCTPRPTSVRGQVSERAIVRSGYLVTLRLMVVVPQQSLNGGTEAAQGREAETLQVLEINGTPSGALG